MNDLKRSQLGGAGYVLVKITIVVNLRSLAVNFSAGDRCPIGAKFVIFSP
jgi:hypothetical protein